VASLWLCITGAVEWKAVPSLAIGRARDAVPGPRGRSAPRRKRPVYRL